jgi:myosin-crossreactive antigen
VVVYLDRIYPALNQLSHGIMGDIALPPSYTDVTDADSELPSITRVAIIGAGISGLATAYHLLRTAQRLGQTATVVIFEKLDGPGGTW